MLLCCRKNENGMCRRLFQSLEEGIESGLAKHMNLVHDEDAVLANLRGDVNLVYKHLDVVHTVVGGRIKFMDAI